MRNLLQATFNYFVELCADGQLKLVDVVGRCWVCCRALFGLTREAFATMPFALGVNDVFKQCRCCLLYPYDAHDEVSR